MILQYKMKCMLFIDFDTKYKHIRGSIYMLINIYQ